MRTDYSFLEQMRQVGDAEADDLVQKVFLEQRERFLFGMFAASLDEARKMTSIPDVSAFLFAPKPLPAWYDDERILRGQRFFKRYALDIMSLLGALSLPYCYAAYPGNKAIQLTGKMRQRPGKRLLDTAQFIITTMSEGSFDNGEAQFEIQRTRLIHASVRYYILNQTKWDFHWGVPVNQEDMAGTNLAFSYIIVKGLIESGFILNDRERDDFLFTWRLIGHGLNIALELLPETFAEAAALEEAIRLRHFRSSPEGQQLMADLLEHYREVFPMLAGKFVDSQIRYLAGPEVATMLGIPAQPAKDAVIRGFNFVRRKINRMFVNPLGYQIMMRNHLMLRKKFR